MNDQSDASPARPATILDNVRLLHPGGQTIAGSIVFSGGCIAASAVESGTDAVRVDGGGRLLTPGLVDVHTHGIHQFLYERSAEDLCGGLRVLSRHGTTSVLPTLYRVLDRANLEKLGELAAALDSVDCVDVPGFHMEGPFLKLPGAGASCLAGDLSLLEDLLAAANKRVAAMSVSPDTPNILPVIERLCEHGIVPFVTHTQADYEQTRAAIAAGARHATHFYDVFPPPEPSEGGVRSVGCVEAMLEDPQCSVDFIADGVHVHPGAIRLALRCKGWQGVVLITDSNIGAGLAEGEYATPWGYSVHVAPGKGARVADRDHPKYGGLAGSALTMEAGMTHMRRWLDLPEAELWATGTLNPARLLGIDKKVGTLQPGARANCVLWDETPQGYQAVATWVNGRRVYPAENF